MTIEPLPPNSSAAIIKEIASFAMAIVGGLILFYAVPGVFLALFCSGAWAFAWGAFASWCAK